MVRVRITSSRSPGTMTSVARAHPLQHVVRLHRADRDALDDAVEVGARRRSPGRARPRGSSPASGSTGSAGTAARRAAGSRGARGPRRSVSSIPGCSSTRTLFTIAPATGTPCACEVRRVEDDLVDRPPDAALGHDHRRRAEHRRDHRVRQPDHRPDARVPGALDEQHVVARELACAARIRAPRSSTTWPAMYALVNPRGMCTGLMTGYDSGRSKIDSSGRRPRPRAGRRRSPSAGRPA